MKSRGNGSRASARLLGCGGSLCVALALLVAGCGGAAAPAPDPSASASGSDKGRVEGLVTVDPVTFLSRVDGTQVKGLLAVPRALQSVGCVIFQGGFRSTKQDAAIAWQGFAGLGLSTFSLDFRLHGERGQGNRSYRRVLDRPKTFAKVVRQSVGDLRSAIDALGRMGACKRNIAYVGISMGGAIGTILAARDQRIKAVVLIVTPGRWRSVLRSRPYRADFVNTRAKLDAVGKVYDPLDPARYVGRIAPRPVLIVSGRDDQVVLPQNSRVLQRAARNPKRVVSLRGGHGLIDGGEGQKLNEELGSFILRTLAQPQYGIKGADNGTFFVQ